MPDRTESTKLRTDESIIVVFSKKVYLRPSPCRAFAAAGIAKFVAFFERGDGVHETLGGLVKELDELRGVLRLPQFRALIVTLPTAGTAFTGSVTNRGE